MENTNSRRKPATGRSDRPARSAKSSDSRRTDKKPARQYNRRPDGRFASKSEKPYDKPYAKDSGRDGEKRYARKYDKSSGKSSVSGKSYGRSSGKPYTRFSEKTYGKNTGKSYGKTDEKSYAKSSGKSYGKKNDRYTRSRKTQRASRQEPAEQVKAKTPVRPETQEFVRLNKFIANSGICSRREADEYIQTGLVTVNGEHVTELGAKVRYGDDVRFNGQRIKGETKVYLVMNKPKDFVTTLADPHAEKTVMDLISPTQCPQRIYPVGRLDKATTGVLMFTNDGELTEKLTHPAFGARKIYHVFLDKNLSKPDFDSILNGITLFDGEIHADSLSYVDGEMTQVGIEIHSGRNRIVRRIFEHFGYKVKKLDRVYFAGLTKKALKRGEWRFLTESEVNKLKMGSFE